MSYAVDTPVAKKPGPAVLISVIVIVIGTVLGITGLAEGIKGAVDDVRGIDSGLTPTTFSPHLDRGTWEIFASAATGELKPSDVTVTDTRGDRITTRALGSTSESRSNGGTTYEGQVEFTISQAGRYKVVVRGDPDVPILLSKSFGDVARHAAKWFILMGLGILAGIAGVVMLIVGIVRRRSASRPPPMAGGGYQVASSPAPATSSSHPARAACHRRSSPRPHPPGGTPTRRSLAAAAGGTGRGGPTTHRLPTSADVTATPPHPASGREPTGTTAGLPGPSPRTALAVVITGAAVVISGLVPGVVSVRRSTRPVGDGVMPGVARLHLTRGTWEIFTADNGGGLGPTDVSISTRGVVAHSVDLGASRSQGGRTYSGQVTFTTTTTGTVRLTLAGTPGTRYFVARTYVSSFQRAAGWFALTGGGALVAVVGLGLLIVGSRRRRRPGGTHAAPWQPVAAPPVWQPDWQPAGPPPGWYADPAYASSGRRWWDGTRWTDHTQAQ